MAQRLTASSAPRCPCSAEGTGCAARKWHTPRTWTACRSSRTGSRLPGTAPARCRQWWRVMPRATGKESRKTSGPQRGGYELVHSQRRDRLTDKHNTEGDRGNICASTGAHSRTCWHRCQRWNRNGHAHGRSGGANGQLESIALTRKAGLRSLGGGAQSTSNKKKTSRAVKCEASTCLLTGHGIIADRRQVRALFQRSDEHRRWHNLRRETAREVPRSVHFLM